MTTSYVQVCTKDQFIRRLPGLVPGTVKPHITTVSTMSPTMLHKFHHPYNLIISRIVIQRPRQMLKNLQMVLLTRPMILLQNSYLGSLFTNKPLRTRWRRKFERNLFLNYQSLWKRKS